MIVDGRALAEEIYAAVKAQAELRPVPPHCTIFTCGPNQATQQYLTLKQKKATAIGIAVQVVELPVTITTNECIDTITRAQMQTDGIVVQLPLPAHLDTDAILNAVPVRYDIDGMHYDGTSATQMHPVVAAMAHICEVHDVLLATQQVVVIGQGRLVGRPAALWAQKQGAHVSVITKETSAEEARALTAHADLLILGAGEAGLVQPDMIKAGVVILDAGTSEAGGQLRGDADPACAAKASLMTPVPGGIGPLTIACLLRNLITATAER